MDRGGQAIERWGRPVGVTQTPDGSLLISDDGGNRIWKVSARGGAASAVSDCEQRRYAHGACYDPDVELHALLACAAQALTPARDTHVNYAQPLVVPQFEHL